MKKVLLIFLFFIFTPINLGICLFSLLQPAKKDILLSPIPAASQLFASVPQPMGEVLGEFTAGDARPVITQKYLQKHNSPLLPYASQLLAASEKYNVDYQLVVAIAQCESNLCKRSPLGSFNCWGFENGETHFLSWERAFDQVTKTLREKYLDLGLVTPEQIMPKYAPPSVEKGGPWAKCVEQFMEELKYGKVD